MVIKTEIKYFAGQLHRKTVSWLVFQEGGQLSQVKSFPEMYNLIVVPLLFILKTDWIISITLSCLESECILNTYYGTTWIWIN